ncbi:M24 family metallopeptidase [Parendozoicomonas haliclonae]|uniref:Putative peptidase n=1 Tax=Parendozoicomonas haliclonae TaxID=1960125 RepID=A0A1X7AF92_9GAMM|nr:Xaa-Pro peptidase family protein [Parendozoicomonas haliclonae]SMA35056.1 putative peptidase [Parendozoicomonas haliclonae]
MTIGVGGKTPAEALSLLSDMTGDLQDIPLSEFHTRIHKAQALMKEQGLDAIYLNAGTNLYYFTGTRWRASERMVGAVLPVEGELVYIVPHFELDTFKQHSLIEAPLLTWQEHEDPYHLTAQWLQEQFGESGKLGIDESTQFFVSDGLRQSLSDSWQLTSATPVTAECRGRKSPNELALMQRAMDMTLEVHKATASILYEGISVAEVTAFIDEAHRKVGAPAGSYFCIVLFGPDSAFPHGVKTPKNLEAGDVVLIDTGCQVKEYLSDITRTYVFGEPTERQRAMWQVEKNAQAAAFAAAKPGVPGGEVDVAARAYLASQGMGPDYETPGCPHRTGHGIGLDIHEWPYLVRSNTKPLATGMCFSNEPMLVLPGEFGIRLEDHFYMTDEGPRWFTEPSLSIDDPFALKA